MSRAPTTAALHYIDRDSVRVYVHSAGCPLRLDSRGRRTSASDWTASLLDFCADSSRRQRFALVVPAGARVLVGPNVVPGVAEVAHGDHLFVGDAELLLNTDAHPLPIACEVGTACTICCEHVGAAGAPRLLGCPRCGAPACEVCWRGFPGERCLTPACEQPASLDRPLWRPSVEDFLCYESEAARGFAQGRTAPWLG